MLSFLKDLIIFIYNDLLVLTSLDRYFFICTEYRFNGKKIFIMFYAMSALFASPICFQLFYEENEINKTISALEIKYFYDEYFMKSVECSMMLITSVVYVFIVLFVYSKSNSFLSIVMVNFKNETKMWVHVKKGQLNSQSSTDNINIKATSVACKYDEYTQSTYNDFDIEKKESAEYNFNLIHFKLFKKTVHWKITVKFMQVN